jgi:hypothetical protein
MLIPLPTRESGIRNHAHGAHRTTNALDPQPRILLIIAYKAYYLPIN